MKYLSNVHSVQTAAIDKLVDLFIMQNVENEKAVQLNCTT